MTALPPLGSGSPLVYLPGLDGTARMLFPHEEALSRDYRLLRVPSRMQRPFRYDDLLDDVLDALDAEHVRRATIVGESFGSTVALQLALRAPERVERLVLVSGFARFPDRTLLTVGNLLSSYVPQAVMLGVRRTLVAPMLALDGVAPEHRRRFAEIALGLPFDGYLGRVALITEYDVRARLAEIDVPVLVLAGTRDKLVPNGCSIELASKLPRATLRVLAGAGHACLLSRRVSFVDLLANWEQKLRSEELSVGSR